MKTNLVIQKMDAMVLVALILSCFSQFVAAQGTIVVGVNGSKQIYPFGITPEGTATYIGEYQQIYASSVFSNPIQITQIAFSSYYPYGGTVNYNLSVGLGITTKTPDSLGTNFGTGFTTVFSGSLSPILTATTNDFDFVINLTEPFTYDPSQGNLLLDVTLSSASGPSSADGFIFEAQNTLTPDMGTIWSSSGSIVTQSDGGLITQFTIIPEPSAICLLFLGSGVLIYVRKRNKKHSKQISSG